MEVKHTREINLNEQDWGIRMILQSYHHHMNEIEEHEDFRSFSTAEDRCIETYEQMIKLFFTAEALRCGDIFTIEDFIDQQISHSFIDYDGFGYYLDWEGNKLGSINWYCFTDYPQGTKFVAWYNK